MTLIRSRLPPFRDANKMGMGVRHGENLRTMPIRDTVLLQLCHADGRVEVYDGSRRREETQESLE